MIVDDFALSLDEPEGGEAVSLGEDLAYCECLGEVSPGYMSRASSFLFFLLLGQNDEQMQSIMMKKMNKSPAAHAQDDGVHVSG